MTEPTFKTVKVYFQASKAKKVIKRGLTEAQAQADVKKDIEINPDAPVYMLCYYSEN